MILPRIKPNRIMPDTPISTAARHNEKMIELRIRLWTNDLAEVKGEIIPKHAWDSGVVFMEKNQSHGIDPANPKPFHSLSELPSMIEAVLIKHGIKLHPSPRSRKYFATQD